MGSSLQAFKRGEEEMNWREILRVLWTGRDNMHGCLRLWLSVLSAGIGASGWREMLTKSQLISEGAGRDELAAILFAVTLSLWWHWSSGRGVCWASCLVLLASWPHFSVCDAFNLLYFPETQPLASQGTKQSETKQTNKNLLLHMAIPSIHSHTCPWHEFEELCSDKDFSLFPVVPTTSTKHLASSFFVWMTEPL